MRAQFGLCHVDGCAPQAAGFDLLGCFCLSLVAESLQDTIVRTWVNSGWGLQFPCTATPHLTHPAWVFCLEPCATSSTFLLLLLAAGKTNTPEFGAGSQTFNKLFGTTLNPWDTSKTVGGSSGGSAAALAVGQVSTAHGSARHGTALYV